MDIVVEKPDKYSRIYINSQEVNHFIENIKPKLINEKYFSPFNLKKGFWQIPLDKRGKEFCLLSTPFVDCVLNPLRELTKSPPTKLKENMLKYLHIKPVGVETTKNNTNFGIKSLTVLVKRKGCQKYHSLNVKEPFVNYEIPNSPYENIAIHYIDSSGKDYFIIICMNGTY
uniref:Reverse transcriptase domain-containing protein n=1 Tax=Glossina palpalis gambiensis TaxID=67801 RepID=A0A1B0BIE6_9MUSC